MPFPIVIHKDPDSDYGVTVPDLPGCFSAGATTDEALSNAVEAIECHVEGLLLDGEKLPTPRTMEFHRAGECFVDGVWALVQVDIKSVPVQDGKGSIEKMDAPDRPALEYKPEVNQGK